MAGEPPQFNDTITFQALSLLYTENAKVAATFWEWRHKVMVRFFAAIAAIAGVGSWLYGQKELKALVFIPLLIGAGFSVVSFLMDNVNRKILLGCYETGKELERQLAWTLGTFTRLSDHLEEVNYSVFLRWLYLGTASIMLTLCTLAAVLLR